MSPLLVLAPVVALYWSQPVESASGLRQAGIERLAVAPDQVEAWRGQGFSAIPMSATELAAREKLPAPGILVRAELASATRSPWVFANGWRFLRKPAGRYSYELPTRKAALAAAEASAYGADAVLKIDPADLPELGEMLRFLAQLPPMDAPAIFDLAVVDDGSPQVGEVMNLLARRNLLYRPVAAPVPQFRINVKLGTAEYPRESATNPGAFASRIRAQLGDEQRALRVYGSEVVVCRLTGDAARARLHLLNYGGREILGLHFRLRGAYPAGEAQAAGVGREALEDHVVTEGVTEFSLPRMGLYAVVDLTSTR